MIPAAVPQEPVGTPLALARIPMGFTHSSGVGLSCIVFLLGACGTGAPADPEQVEQGGYRQGVQFDETNPGAVLGPGEKGDGRGYQIPTELPVLVAPEVIVSLDGLTVHLFDRVTRFSRVYPTGVGAKENGVSLTPTGHYHTGNNIDDAWWYVPRRYVPDYFAGLPFLRIDAHTPEGALTYGLHGPVTDRLIRGFVSHGCMRMEKRDIIELFFIVRRHPSTPVSIQREFERDADDNIVDVGTDVTLWQVGDRINFGSSVGPRPELPPPPPKVDTSSSTSDATDVASPIEP